MPGVSTYSAVQICGAISPDDGWRHAGPGYEKPSPFHTHGQVAAQEKPASKKEHRQLNRHDQETSGGLAGADPLKNNPIPDREKQPEEQHLGDNGDTTHLHEAALPTQNASAKQTDIQLSVGEMVLAARPQKKALGEILDSPWTAAALATRAKGSGNRSMAVNRLMRRAPSKEVAAALERERFPQAELKLDGSMIPTFY